MKPRTNTWAGSPCKEPASSASMVDRGTLVDADTSPTVRALCSLARRRQLPKCSLSMESELSSDSSPRRVFFNVFGQLLPKSVCKLTARVESCQRKYLSPNGNLTPITLHFS